MNVNGIRDMTFRFTNGEGQHEVAVDALYDAWCDALDLLRLHGLDHKLPQRTLEAMGYEPEVR